MERYSIIHQKNKREIVLLRGNGCKWRKCSFCDYHLDFSTNETENFKINSEVLGKVTGVYGRLEVINSGSFCDLDNKTMEYIRKICIERGIKALHFECHYLHRQYVPLLKEYFAKDGILVYIKTGVETFDVNYREKLMHKGFNGATPKEISEYADEVCLLFGLSGQTYESMKNDINIGLENFSRVCVNIFTPNSTKIKPDYDVINVFRNEIAPLYMINDRIDILFDNTDFGVGGECDD